MFERVSVKPPAVPIALATAYLLDTTWNPGTGTGTTGTLYARNQSAYKNVSRVQVGVYVDQALTFYVDWLDAISTTWRTVNGGGSGETVSASTYFFRDVARMGHDMRLRLVAGGTPPTTWEVTTVLIVGDQAAAV